MGDDAPTTQRRGLGHHILVYLGVRDDRAIRPPLEEDDDGLARYLVRYAVIGAAAAGVVTAVAYAFVSAGVPSPPWWVGLVVGIVTGVVRTAIALRRSG